MLPVIGAFGGCEPRPRSKYSAEFISPSRKAGGNAVIFASFKRADCEVMGDRKTPRWGHSSAVGLPPELKV